MFELSGKRILVAGGAGYLGAAVCTALSKQGAHVMIADIALDHAGTLAQKLSKDGGRVQAVRLDVADESSVTNAVEKTVESYGGLDVLVNAVFAAAGKSVEDLTAAEFDRANRVNLTGGFLLARAAAHAMEDGGSIIFFTSMYGLVAPDPRIYHAPMNPNPIEYGVAKAGVIQMTKYLAVHWGARGIRVNAIAPGPFPNPGVQQDHPDFVTRLAERVPLGRIGDADEIPGAVAFLASDASTYMNGATLNIDGGWTVW